MLTLHNVHGGYGAKKILFGMNMEVGSGQVVTMMGRNGMGKTTCIRTIMGFNDVVEGVITFAGENITGSAPHRVARAGIGLVPEGRQIFTKLTVRENLIATASAGHDGKGHWKLENIYRLFPRLKERESNMGWQLSGGEQQMLAIGRALMTNPRLLILDEATEGVAPLVRQEIWDCLAHVKKLGQSILIVDKNLEALLELADYHYIVEKGQVVWHGSSSSLREAHDVYERHLGV